MGDMFIFRAPMQVITSVRPIELLYMHVIFCFCSNAMGQGGEI